MVRSPIHVSCQVPATLFPYRRQFPSTCGLSFPLDANFNTFKDCRNGFSERGLLWLQRRRTPKAWREGQSNPAASILDLIWFRKLDAGLFKTDPDAKVVRKREDISSIEPSRHFIAIYRPAALSTLWDLNGIRGLIQNGSTVHLLAHGNPEERGQGFWNDHVSYTNEQFGAKSREVPTESLAAELHSLVAECVKSLTFEDHCQIAGVNGSIPAAPAGEHQSSSIKKQARSAATNNQESLGAEEQSAAPLGEARMGLRQKLGLTLRKVSSKGRLKRPESPDSPVTAIRRSPISQRASQFSERANSSSSHVVDLNELLDDPPLQWPLPPKDHQERCEGFRELIDSSIWPKSMNRPDSFEQPRSSPPSQAEVSHVNGQRMESRYHRTTPRINVA